MTRLFTLGRPGVGSVSNANQGYCTADGACDFLPGFRLIDSIKARDPSNAPDGTTLRAGLVLGRLTGTNPGVYANSILGLTVAAAAAGATTITLTPAGAAELARRGGATGSLTLTGPPTAGGVCVALTVAYTAVNPTTGAVTVNALPAAVVANSPVGVPDGSQNPLTFVPDGFGILVSPNTPLTEFPRVPYMAVLDQSRLIDWPPDVSTRAFLRAAMCSPDGGKFTFLDKF